MHCEFCEDRGGFWSGSFGDVYWEECSCAGSNPVYKEALRKQSEEARKSILNQSHGRNENRKSKISCEVGGRC